MTEDYPRHREADVVLRDGSTIHLRPVRAGDLEAVEAFFAGLSDESSRLRFFGIVQPGHAATWATTIDYRTRYGLVATAATAGEDARIVASAGYVVGDDDGEAEVAFAIADELQGKGIGTILLAHLAEAAADNGIGLFVAHVLLENRRMIDVFRQSGFPVTTRAEPGELAVRMPTSLTPEALDRYEAREAEATVAALRTLLAPASIAVVGASRSRGTIGGEVFHNLISGGFAGPVFPVNPNAKVVQSVLAYPSVQAVPQPVETAIIVVPAAAVADAARDCAAAGVKGLVVISSGFSEVGEAGLARQRELLDICRESGLRLIGPNCMGVANTAANVRMNATFAPMMVPRGRVGFMSQSGALGLAVIDRATDLGLGISSFVSVGNKADISGNDLLQYWEADSDTDLILLYLESFGNPRKFARLSRRVGRTKPIVAVKSGRSGAGARATTSHTGALIAASDVTVDALFHQAGVIRTDTLAGLFDVASLLANQPAPRGPRVGIVTNAGGLGILCADACEADGLEVPELSEGFRERLAAFLPGEASVNNPVDMIASASAEDYGRTIELVAGSGEVDAVIVIFIPPLVTRAEDVARALRSSAESVPAEVTLLSVFASTAGVPAEDKASDSDGRRRIPSYAFPEEAAGALAKAARYGAWLTRPEGVVAELPGLRLDDAAALAAASLGGGGGWLAPEVVSELLACFGIPTGEERFASSPEEAGEAAEALRGTVALKAIAPTLLHKTEARGVRLGLSGRDAVEAAAREMALAVEVAGHRVERFLVQAMVEGGHELLVGVVHDPSFGPVVACGAGGVTAELVRDVAVRITPLTDLDASDMVRSLKVFPLLEGYRGGPKGDLAGLEELLLRVSAMVEAVPQIAEMDLNPVKVLPDRVVAVDARIRIEPATPAPPLGARRP